MRRLQRIRGIEPPRRGYPQGFGPPRFPPIDARRPAYGTGPTQGHAVTDKRDRILTSIEETQAALRESIETAKQLAEKSDFLLRKHKSKLEQDAAELDAHLRKDAE